MPTMLRGLSPTTVPGDFFIPIITRWRSKIDISGGCITVCTELDKRITVEVYVVCGHPFQKTDGWVSTEYYGCQSCWWSAEQGGSLRGGGKGIRHHYKNWKNYRIIITSSGVVPHHPPRIILLALKIEGKNPMMTAVQKLTAY